MDNLENNDLNVDNSTIFRVQSFEKDIINEQFNSKLKTLFETEISEIFPNILKI